MKNDLISVAFCYFTNSSEKDFLSLSLQNLINLTKRDYHYDYKIYVIDDARIKTKIEKSDLPIECELKRYTFKMEGFEGVEGMFKTFCEIYKDFNFDYIVTLKEDCILNHVGFITAIEQRTKKQSNLGLSQISKQIDKISTNDWQCFSKIGVQTIMNTVNGVKNDNDPKAVLLKKRMRHNPYTNKLISYLLEMSAPIRINIDYLEGVKTNVNYFEMKQGDKKEDYLSISFKNKKIDRKESLNAMSNIVNEAFIQDNDFFKSIKGKKVAIVGNAEVDKDYSEEIDSADFVIRFNNFYNYQSEKVGKRIDGLVLTGTSACHDKLPDGLSDQKEIIQKYLPKLFLLSEIPNQKITRVHQRYKGCELHMLGNPSWMLPLTSGTIVLAMLADYDDVKVNCYGFSDGDAWEEYNKTYNKGHRATCGISEEKIRMESFYKLSKKKWE